MLYILKPLCFARRFHYFCLVKEGGEGCQPGVPSWLTFSFQCLKRFDVAIGRVSLPIVVTAKAWQEGREEEGW